MSGVKLEDLVEAEDLAMKILIWLKDNVVICDCTRSIIQGKGEERELKIFTNPKCPQCHGLDWHLFEEKGEGKDGE